MAEDIAVECRGVKKSFGDLKVLDGISCKIPAGKTTVIMGPSGTGKSVLIKHVVGLLSPDAGDVIVFGKNVPTLKQDDLYALRRRLGMLFQDGALFDSMTVGENIAFPLVHHTDYSASKIRSIVKEKLRLVELEGTEDRFPSQLSGGMRKRVGLARAIVLEPELVVFDEPHSGLDPLTAESIDELIIEMKQRLGITFLVISHDIAGVFKIADYAGMLYEGKLIAFGPALDVRQDQHPVLQQFVARGVPSVAELKARQAPIKLIGGSKR